MEGKATAAAGAVLVTLCAGQFLMMLDSSVMNVSIATPARVKTQATTQLSGGAQFISDAELEEGLKKAHVPPRASEVIGEENETARLKGLRTALSVLAILALIALFFSRWIPTEPPASESEASPSAGGQPELAAAT